jgi:hypothetical protein
MILRSAVSCPACQRRLRFDSSAAAWLVVGAEGEQTANRCASITFLGVVAGTSPDVP